MSNMGFSWIFQVSSLGSIPRLGCPGLGLLVRIGSMGNFHRNDPLYLPIGSMGLMYLPSFVVDLYGFHVGKYTSPMNPMDYKWGMLLL